MLTIAWWLHRWPGSAEGRRRNLHSSRSADPAAEPVGGQTRKLKIQQHMFTSRNTATGQQTQQQNLWGVKQGNERYSNTSLPAIWVGVVCFFYNQIYGLENCEESIKAENKPVKYFNFPVHFVLFSVRWEWLFYLMR